MVQVAYGCVHVICMYMCGVLGMYCRLCVHHVPMMCLVYVCMYVCV
jgi:hypothetical protein